MNTEFLEKILPYIGVGLALIILILLIFVIIRIMFINRRLGDQDFEILEAIKKDEHEVIYFDMTVSNKAFSTNFLNKVGFNKGNVIQILSEIDVAIAPRTKHPLSFPMSQIETLTIVGVNKFKRIKLFAENELGLRQESKGKLINKYLKRAYKANKRKERKLAKDERFETGNYKLRERFWLIVKLFFRPFYKLFSRMRQSTNIALKESEIRRFYKAEHDKIEKNLVLTTAQANELKIKEESYNENKTKETMLELLKQEKVLEIQQLKLVAYEKAFEEKKEEILAINPQKEFEKFIKENPINYDDIEVDVIKSLLIEIKQDIELKPKEVKTKKSKVKTPIIKAEITEEKAEIEEENLPNELETSIETKPQEQVDLHTLKVTELKELAKEKGVKYYGTMKKSELLEALKE